MSVISLSSFLLVSSFPISFLSLLWQFRYSSLALVLLLLFPCLHISLKLLRNCFLSFLSVFIVSFEVFIFLLVSKDIFPICLFNADIIVVSEPNPLCASVSYTLGIQKISRFCIFHHCTLSTSLCRLFPDVDDIRFVGSFQLDCQSNGSVVSYMFSSFVEGIVCVSFRFADFITETIGDDSIVNY